MIETQRLQLIPCKLQHFEAFNQKGEAKVAELLNLSIAEGWLVFPEAMKYGYEYLKNNPADESWWMYFFVSKSDSKLIGNGGFKGKPDENKIVEIGYAIAPGYRGKGLATEAAQGLIDFAFSHPQVKIVQAHTLAEENESVKVLRKLKMNFVKEIHDEEDGNIWQWTLAKKS